MKFPTETSRHNKWVILLLVGVALLAWLPKLNTLSTGYVDDGLKRSLATFAIARGMNAVISVLQSTTIDFKMIAGIAISPGELLDPLNDMVEDFSNIMLFISAAFAVQKLLLMMGASKLLPALLGVTAAVGIMGLHRKGQLPRFVKPLLLTLILARFGLPLAAIGSDLAWDHFMQDGYQTAEQSLTQGTATLELLKSDLTPASASASKPETPAAPPSPEESAPHTGFMGLVKDKVTRMGNAVSDGAKNLIHAVSTPFQTLENIKHRIAEIEGQVDDWVRHMVDLIALFLMQAVLIPVLLFWGMYRGLRLALRAESGPQRS